LQKKKLLLFFSCDGKVEFSAAINLVFIVTWSWFGAQETFLIIILNFENSCAA